MPLTFSHPAAAVPFSRWGLPLSALVVGSMSPDFAYFLTQSTLAKIGHTLPGIVLFCIPVGFLVLWTFHAIVKRPLLELLPDRLHRTFAPAVQPFAFGPARRTGLILIALLVGTLTHLLWDQFTGADRLGAILLPWLNEPIISFWDDDISGYRVLHFLSSIGGILLLIFWSVRYLKRHEGVDFHSSLSPLARAMIVIFILGVTAVVFWIQGGIDGNSLFGRHWEVRGFLQSGLIASVPVLYGLLLLYGSIRQIQYRRARAT